MVPCSPQVRDAGGRFPPGGPASADVQRQRMNTLRQIPQRRMNRAVAGKAGQGGQLGRADRDVEMRLAAFAPAAMATVFLAIILNLKHFRAKCRCQALKNLVFHSHFYRCPLHAAAQCFILCAPSLKGLP